MNEDEIINNDAISPIENTTAKLPPLTTSADNFLAIQHGMEREYSIVDHIPSDKLSNVFDEEYCPGQQCVGVHSGEIGFENSKNSFGTKEQLAQINSKLLKSRVWSPRLTAGYSDLDHKEYFNGHNAQSQILRFSEEELLEGKDEDCNKTSANNQNETISTNVEEPEFVEVKTTPKKGSSHLDVFNKNDVTPDLHVEKLPSEKLDEILGNLRSSYEVAIKTVEANNSKKSDQDEHSSANIERSHSNISVSEYPKKNCTTLCKFTIPPGYFPFMAPFLAMIGGQNCMDQNSSSSIEPDQNSSSSNEQVVTSSSREGDKNIKNNKKEESLTSEIDEEQPHNGNTTEQNEVHSENRNKHKKHKKKKTAEEEQEDPNIVALFKAIQTYQNSIKEAKPIRDSFLKILEKFYDPDEKRVSKKDVSLMKEKYKSTYQKVNEAKIAYNRTLNTLGYGVRERSAMYENASDLEKAYKEMEPEVFDCGTKEILINLEKDLRSLMESMPLEELEQFTDLLDEKPEPAKTPPLVPVDSETGEIKPLKKNKKPKKLKKKDKPDHRSFPDCLEIPGPSKKSLREFRLNLLKDLTEKLSKGPGLDDSGRNMHPAHTFGLKVNDKKKQLEMDKVVKTANILLTKEEKPKKAPYILASTPYEQGLHKSLHYASAFDGRRDFREVVGVTQLKTLWPILMKLDIGKRRVTPDELHKYVKESGIGEGSFTFDTAVHICQEWKKGRRIDFEEAIFAVHNPKNYICLCSTGQLNYLKDEIKKWHTHVPSKTDFAEKSLPKPRSLYSLPKRKNSIGCIYNKAGIPTVEVSAGYRKNAMKEYSQHVLKAVSMSTKQSLHRAVNKSTKVKSFTCKASPINTLRSNSITSDVATIASFKNPNASQDDIPMDNNADYNIIIHHDGVSSGHSLNFPMEISALKFNPKEFNNNKTSFLNSSTKKKLPKTMNGFEENATIECAEKTKNKPCNKYVTFKDIDPELNGNVEGLNICSRNTHLNNKGQCKYQKLKMNLQRIPKDILHRHGCLLTGIQYSKPTKFHIDKKTQADKNTESLPNINKKYKLSDMVHTHNKLLVPSGFHDSTFDKKIQLPNINNF